uniref:Ig-like domain-containing protein n=1 Tax=Oreochromis aureus TaxID=47969 RepID=A0AAZ1XP16_OREAU
MQLCIFQPLSTCAELQPLLYQKNITAESGQDVTLTCRAPNNNIMVVEWSRADLGDEYVLLYRDDHLHSDNQHPSFKNRVDLQMKDGDVSLILKDVTINDTGTYECRVQRQRESLSLITSVYLSVLLPCLLFSDYKLEVIQKELIMDFRKWNLPLYALQQQGSLLDEVFGHVPPGGGSGADPGHVGKIISLC